MLVYLVLVFSHLLSSQSFVLLAAVSCLDVTGSVHCFKCFSLCKYESAVHSSVIW